jgi:hypothetical protein
MACLLLCESMPRITAQHSHFRLPQSEKLSASHLTAYMQGQMRGADWISHRHIEGRQDLRIGQRVGTLSCVNWNRNILPVVKFAGAERDGESVSKL